MKTILPIILGILMILGAVTHIANPEFYAKMVPDFIPLGVANILAAIVEVVVGVLLLIPKYRYWGGLSFLLLMLAFLPLHVWDFFKESPAVGAPPAPAIRLVFQFLLIYAGWWIYKKTD
ncbi:MAG: hypothetical protein AAFO07_15400 [Bacteroidota bacterium]